MPEDYYVFKGLDPAGPGFENHDELTGLNPTSGDFVDVMHTNTRLKGISRTVGHVDFYPDDGRDQRACPLSLLIDRINGFYHRKNPRPNNLYV